MSYPVLVVEVTPGEVDVAIGRLTLLGADGIEQRDESTLVKGGPLGVTLLASFADDSAAESARESLGPEYSVRLEALVGDAWRDAWKEHWRPTRITSRIVVVPSWMTYEPVEGDLVLQLDPGRAFGTGQHASTTLCARALERRILRGPPPAMMIDLGSGSGILSFVGLALGVKAAIACDVDPESVAAARENAERIGCEARFDMRTGSTEVVPERAPLVVANIEAVVLIPLAASVADKVAPGGSLILSGILVEQRKAVEDAYIAEGLVPDGGESEAGWVAPEFLRPLSP